eukprot:381787-Ditylum_brightwellii.AAC.1
MDLQIARGTTKIMRVLKTNPRYPSCLSKPKRKAGYRLLIQIGHQSRKELKETSSSNLHIK